MQEIFTLLDVIDKLEQSYSIRIFSDLSGRIIENEDEDYYRPEFDFENLEEAKKILMNLIINLKTN
jgi:hypothetical protein